MTHGHGGLVRVALLYTLIQYTGLCCSNPSGADQTGSPEGRSSQQSSQTVQVKVLVEGLPEGQTGVLQPDEFSVVDNGNPQRVISVTSAQNNVPCEAHAAPPSGSRGTFTNCVGRDGRAPGGAIAIVVDWSSMRSVKDMRRASRGILNMVQEVSPDVPICLYSLWRRSLRVLHDCSQDVSGLRMRAAEAQRSKKELLEVVETPGRPGTSGYSAGSSAGPSGFSRGGTILRYDFEKFAAFERALGGGDGSLVRLGWDASGIGPLRLLGMVADHMAQFRGRKSVIWVAGKFPVAELVDNAVKSSGVPLSKGRFGSLVCRFFHAINAGDLAIYPVDAAGAVDRRNIIDQVQVTTDPLQGPHAPEFNYSTRLGAPLKDLKTLAEFTGGRAYRDTETFKGVVRHVVEDTNRTYTLSFRPENQHMDGKLHSLKVSSTRRGLKISCADGYFALPAHSRDEESRKMELGEAIVNPADTSELRLFAQAKPNAEVAGSNDVRVEVQLPEDVSRESGRLGHPEPEVNFVEDVRGLRVTFCEQTAIAEPAEGKPENLGAGSRVVVLHRRVQCSPSARQVRVVVRELRSGDIGSVTIPLRSN
ncbi:MAG: VWA domain-containing protein [Bryobacteraceae bacterium]